jgi:TonB family protein
MGGPAVPPPRKSSCGKIILIVGIILVLLAAGIAAAVYFGYRYAEKTLKSSEAYTLAVKALKENPEVMEKLGEIKETGFPLGAFSTNADGTGDAAFTMSVQGTKGNGQYEVMLKRRDHVWHIENGSVRTASGEVIRIEAKPLIDIPEEDVNSNTDDVNRDVDSSNTITGGVMNDKAISLPKPAYPQIAKAAKASGTVVVQVLVDEQGNVVSARVVSGHPLLHGAARAAARQAKFPPAKRAGRPMKVSGVINYNFTLEQ